MRFLSFLAALTILIFVSNTSTYAQGCYSGSVGLTTVDPQTFTTVHTVNVPTQVVVQHTVQAVVQQPQVQVQAYAAPVCQQSFGAAYGASSCGNSAVFAAPFVQSYGVARPNNFQSYGHVNSFQSFNSGFNGGFRNFNSFNSGFNSGLLNGGRGVSIIAQDRRGTQIQGVGTNNVKVSRGLFGNINGVSADRRGGLGGLLPF
jgi:hypothetical protein